MSEQPVRAVLIDPETRTLTNINVKPYDNQTQLALIKASDYGADAAKIKFDNTWLIAVVNDCGLSEGRPRFRFPEENYGGVLAGHAVVFGIDMNTGESYECPFDAEWLAKRIQWDPDLDEYFKSLVPQEHWPERQKPKPDHDENSPSHADNQLLKYIQNRDQIETIFSFVDWLIDHDEYAISAPTEEDIQEMPFEFFDIDMKAIRLELDSRSALSKDEDIPY